MLAFRIDEQALFELLEAKEFYLLGNAERATLFMDRVDAAIALIRDFPESGTLIPDSVGRWVPVRGFPYKIAHEIRARSVVIMVVAHTSRDPDSWRARLDEPT